MTMVPLSSTKTRQLLLLLRRRDPQTRSESAVRLEIEWKGVIAVMVGAQVIGIDQRDGTVEMPLVQLIETESVVARQFDQREIVVNELDAIVVAVAAVAVLEIVEMTAGIDVTADATIETVEKEIEEDVSGQMTFLHLVLPTLAILT